MEPSGPNKKAIIAIIVVVLLVIVATGVVIAADNKNTSQTTATAPSVSASPSSSASASGSSSTSFKDGTYTATGSYDSPGGKESIDVKLTLSGGVITSSSLTKHPNDSEAAMYQSQFESGYQSKVIGKKITDVNLSRVAGSSLTSIGFNSAIADIEKQARV